MKLTFLGAAGTVTGSKHLLDCDGTRILFDCGLFQGLKKLRQRNWSPFPVDVGSIDAIVLTHAHIDHSGYLPVLVREGYSGPIYCTEATADLAAILLPDSGRIHEEDAKYANRKGFSRHAPAKPLCTEADARRTLQLLERVPFDRPFPIGGAEVRFRRAGHILGAASAAIELGGQRLLFSGDVGRQHDLLLEPPEPPMEADWIVMESTYGDRLHDTSDPLAALELVVERAIAKRGTLIIPSFAVGRAQAMLYCLYRLFQDYGTPKVPVFVDSPMSTSVTRIYRRNKFDHKLSSSECTAAFGIAQFVSSVGESKKLSANKKCKVIISASGMVTAGRVLHHLKAFLGDAANTVLLPSYQAPGTRGAALAAGADALKIHGRYFAVKAEVEKIDLFSAHADQEGLLTWLGQAPAPPRRIFLVHGEPQAADTLRVKIGERFGHEVHVPDHLETVELS
ncbi:MAG: MBL fold metallo-hydrolase [Acidobacteriota bacterium]|nr:MBL fold metallo-hydrolase [Acidobacteriota bacterium]MDH3524769.1 MBL fold metallo-hydrolase [Acidobacteriota bacterium]